MGVAQKYGLSIDAGSQLDAGHSERENARLEICQQSPKEIGCLVITTEAVTE